MADFSGVNLTNLEDFMNRLPPVAITPEDMIRVQLLKVLRGNINRRAIIGDKIKVLIQTRRAYSGKGHGEQDDIPLPRTIDFEPQLIDVKDVMVTAGVTGIARRRARGGSASYSDILTLSIEQMYEDLDWTLELACLLNQRAALARVLSAVYAAGPPKTITFTCDNTYTDFGVENAQLLRDDMYVDVYDSTMAALTDTSATNLRVLSKSFGNRNNGAATTGTVTVEVASDWAAAVADNDVIVLYGSADKLPMGLLGIVQDGVHYGGVAQLASFQNLARSAYPTLRSPIYQATDFGLESQAPADGVPTAWGLSVISDALTAGEDACGEYASDLFMHGDLARLLARLQRDESPISINVTQPTSDVAGGTAAVGDRFAQQFQRPDGVLIPIHVVRALPRNVMYGVVRDHLEWHPDGDFDFLRESGTIWEVARDSRKWAFEAPYGGAYNISSRRCDGHFCIQDMSTAFGT